MKKIGTYNDCMCWRMLYSRALHTACCTPGHFIRPGRCHADVRVSIRSDDPFLLTAIAAAREIL